jgi:hypothetical protein
MSDLPLTEQLACARRELALRMKVYPRWVAHEQMTERAAKREILAMTAIVHTLEALVEAEASHQQPRLFLEPGHA